MCGLIACDTPGPAAPLLAEALGRLEYRGYDSVGIGVADPDGQVHTLRTVDRIGDLRDRLPDFGTRTSGHVGIGHSRWATHGEVSERNAHPHLDCTGRLVVAHNGVITNAGELSAELVVRGHVFASAVDSEVIAHLLEEHLPCGSLHGAMLATVARLQGSWAIVALDASTGQLVTASHQCPVVVGESDAGTFVASDVSAIAGWVHQVRVLEDGDVVSLGTQGAWTRDGRRVDSPAPVPCAVHAADLDLGQHPDFMSKEIDEQPQVAERIVQTLSGPAGGPELWQSLALPRASRLLVVGCGTSLNAGRAIGALVTSLGGMPHQCVVASEATSAMVEPGTLILALSQSGETADVLRAIDRLGRGGAPVLALTNNPHSALGRRADAVLPCHAGVEVGVAATKTFTAQVLTGACLALSMMSAHQRLSPSRARRHARQLRHVPDLLAHAVGVSRAAVPRVVEQHLHAPGYIFLGRGRGHVYAEEGALKLKELTYRWTESPPAGELKHGPLALVEQGTPVLVVDDGAEHLDVNIAEVRARGAQVVRIGASRTDVPVLPGPTDPPGLATADWIGPLGAVIALQVYARELALALGRDVDKPRNLAKSVTVE